LHYLFCLSGVIPILQRVSREVPLDGVLEGVGTLEELCALLLTQGPLGGIHVLVQKLPELIGHVENLEVLGQLESILEPLGDISEGILIPEDLADQQLLAVNIVVVELLINLLEHGDPLQNVHGIEVIAEVSGPGLVLVVALAVVLAISLVAGAGGGGEEAANIDQVEDDAEEDEGAQQGQRGGGGRGVEVEEPSLGLSVHDLSAVKV